jgi:DNA adenine methylase
MGGKRKLARHILERFQEHTCYVEPFCGGAAVFFLKEPSHVEVLNDLNGELINLYRVVQHHLDEFVRQFRWALVSREIFHWLLDCHPEMLTDIQRAARFFYLQKTAFGAKVSGRNFGTSALMPPRLNLTRMEEDLSMAHLRLAHCLIERLPWEECIRRYDRPGTLFYCDPPYWGTEGYGIPFGMDQDARMAECSRTIQGRMLISINDCPEMRSVFGGLEFDELRIRYSVSNRKAGSGEPSSELLLRNF